MADKQDLCFRAHTVPLKPQKEYQNNRQAKMPEDALIFHCATTGDQRKELLVGAQAPYTIADWQRRAKRKWKEDLPPWVFEVWHFSLSRELGPPCKPPSWLKQLAVMAVP